MRRAVPCFSFLVLAFLVVVVGCGPEPARRQVCEPGETQECLCSPGLSGIQECSDDGERWLACQCDSGDGDADTDSDTDSDTDVDSDSDADHDPDYEPPPPVTAVDILFVIDNSNSMHEEQIELARQFEPLVRELLDPTAPSTPAVSDLHVGVVTTDMGTGGYNIMTCENPMQGDNGVLQNEGRFDRCAETYSALDCDRAVCPWLSHSTALPDDGTDRTNPPIWEDFDCIGQLGTGGCGFEQQLEASLVALTVQGEPGRPNEGFLRDDALLVVLYVTDEDDCSTGNPEMFNPGASDLGPLNVRCALREDMLYPVSRYFDGLVGLKDYVVGHLFVAAITGVPVDGTWEPGDPIDDLRALRQVDPSNPNELLPSCETGMGFAFPPVRIAELVYMFRDYGYLASICETDWTTTLSEIAYRIQARLER